MGRPGLGPPVVTGASYRTVRPGLGPPVVTGASYRTGKPGLGPPVVTEASFRTGTPGLGPPVVTGTSFRTGTAYGTVKLTATLNPVPVLRMCGAKAPFPMYLRGVLLNYRGADKSLARRGMKQANVSVRMREFPSASCLAGKRKLDDNSRLDVVEIARGPDMLPCLFPSWSG